MTPSAATPAAAAALMSSQILPDIDSKALIQIRKPLQDLLHERMTLIKAPLQMLPPQRVMSLQDLGNRHKVVAVGPSETTVSSNLEGTSFMQRFKNGVNAINSIPLKAHGVKPTSPAFRCNMTVARVRHISNFKVFQTHSTESPATASSNCDAFIPLPGMSLLRMRCLLLKS